MHSVSVMQCYTQRLCVLESPDHTRTFSLSCTHAHTQITRTVTLTYSYIYVLTY